MTLIEQILVKEDNKEELAGVNPSELEFMSAKEREKVLQEAGLDPKQYDF